MCAPQLRLIAVILGEAYFSTIGRWHHNGDRLADNWHFLSCEKCFRFPLRSPSVPTPITNPSLSLLKQAGTRRVQERKCSLKLFLRESTTSVKCGGNGLPVKRIRCESKRPHGSPFTAASRRLHTLGARASMRDQKLPSSVALFRFGLAVLLRWKRVSCFAKWLSGSRDIGREFMTD